MVGYGKSVMFWHEGLFGDTFLIDLFPNLFVIVVDKDVTVHSCLELSLLGSLRVGRVLYSVKFLVGDGKSMQFWHKGLFRDTILIDLFRDLFVIIVDKDVTVYSCLKFKEDGKFYSLNLRFSHAFYNWEVELVDFFFVLKMKGLIGCVGSKGVLIN